MASYATRLHAAVQEKRTPALVGLDPRWDLLPADVVDAANQRHPSDVWAARASAFEEFCKRIIEVVAPLVPAVKPQAAFFEQLGPSGCVALSRVIRAAREAGLLVIADVKRGDIGSTAAAYADAYLAGGDPDAAPFSADAMTVNAYLGLDTLAPFVSRANETGAGIYVLVRTSNPGAGDLQDLRVDGEFVYQRLATRLQELTGTESGSTYSSVGAVIGATYPSELASLRKVLTSSPLLIPGYGAQGGSSSDTAAAFDDDGLGALVNSSRGINFAFRKPDFEQEFGANWQGAIEAATRAMIDDLARNTPAGQLREAR